MKIKHKNSKNELTNVNPLEFTQNLLGHTDKELELMEVAMLEPYRVVTRLRTITLWAYIIRNHKYSVKK
jgi:hypothetical protein